MRLSKPPSAAKVVDPDRSLPDVPLSVSGVRHALPLLRIRRYPGQGLHVRRRMARPSAAAVSARIAAVASRPSSACSCANSWWSRRPAARCRSTATSWCAPSRSRCASARSSATASSAPSPASSGGWKAPARWKSRRKSIGLQVLEALKSLDDVAFVRYASVYRDFSHAEDFEKVIAEINAKIARDPGLGS